MQYRQSAIIVDIDGTLARHPQRGHHEYAKVFTDEPVQPIIDLVLLFDAMVDCVLFVSGRPDSCREDTINWIEKFMPNVSIDNDFYYLFMRKTGDYHKDDIVKKEIYDNEIKDKFVVYYVVDDRNRVVAMWRSLGLTVLQVADGDF